MRAPPNALMIFAAGRGTRMAPLTDTRPKPLIDVAGKALLDYALDLAETADITQIVVNTHYLSDQIEAHLSGRPIQISHESTLLETGGGLRKAIPLLGDGPVMTLNSDAVWKGPNPLQILLDAWQTASSESLLLCVPKDRAVGHLGQGDFLPGPPVRRGQGVVYTGAQIIMPDGLIDIEDDVFSMNKIWDVHLQNETLSMAHYPGTWCDVGQPSSIALAEALIRDV